MPDWESLLAAAADRLDAPVRAATFIKKFGTASQPVLVQCEDGNEYVVKAKHAGRMIVTDQIVGRLGRSARAPVAEPALVNVPAELIDAEPEMSHVSPGVAHGSKWIPGCTDRMGFEHCSGNRDRFARLALLYGWTEASDQQFIYETEEPRLVHSVDHGHFFAGSTGWTVETLRNALPPSPDPTVVAGCGLSAEELDAARTAMVHASDECIAEAVTSPHDDWGISLEERIAAADYLATRRDVVFGTPEKDEEDRE